jgi:hypothetical protein
MQPKKRFASAVQHARTDCLTDVRNPHRLAR